ncbi:MAG: polyhydroxyalkanoic acid system family protein [Methylocystis sp.]|nr:polyhydroxyalkanoic acid system family protein [Methylocystis sp.]
MSPITIIVPHKLGAEAAKKRVADQLVKLQQEYVSKVAHSEISWAGDVATVSVSAFGQQAKAEISVLPDSLRVDIHLPAMLAMFAGKVKEIASRRANDALRIGHG